MTTATWATAEIPADRLAVGDRIDFESTTDITLTTVRDWGQDVILGPVQADIDEWTVQVHYRGLITVHVPDEPVDGYNLWQPKQGVWPGGCTCIHRRLPAAGNWVQIGRDCPACLRESDPHRDDD